MPKQIKPGVKKVIEAAIENKIPIALLHKNGSQSVCRFAETVEFTPEGNFIVMGGVKYDLDKHADYLFLPLR